MPARGRRAGRGAGGGAPSLAGARPGARCGARRSVLRTRARAASAAGPPGGGENVLGGADASGVGGAGPLRAAAAEAAPAEVAGPAGGEGGDLEGWEGELAGQFDAIEAALGDLRAGKFVVVLDDEARENEGDLIMCADRVTAADIAFMVRHTSGLLCVGMEGQDVDRLGLPQMVESRANEEAMATAFTVSVDLQEGTHTGISAHDRALTIRALADPDVKGAAFVKPGHVFPLRAREGGVLKRGGHTEAAADLARLAGSHPSGVLCELVNDDGTMMRGPQLLAFARAHGLKAITISDLIVHRRVRESIVERTALARLPTRWGDFRAVSYRSKLDGIEHVAMVCGDVGDGEDVLVRVHSECITGDIFASRRCDCGPQLDKAMELVAAEGRGVIVYLRGQEGRGIGLGHKLRAYNLQDAGKDTVEANVELGLPVDSREYGVGAHILKDVGVNTLRLLTNNPAKYTGLKGYGLEILERISLVIPPTADNRRYIETKREKMGHIYDESHGQGHGHDHGHDHHHHEHGEDCNCLQGGHIEEIF